MKSKLLNLVYSIKFKLVVIFITLFLIPFLFVQTLIAERIEKQELINVEESMTNNLSLISHYTNAFLGDVQEDLQNIVYKEEFITSLFNIKDLESITSYEDLSLIEYLTNEISVLISNERIDSVYIFSRDRDVFYDFSLLIPNYLITDIDTTQWFTTYEDNLDTAGNHFRKNWTLTSTIPNVGKSESDYIVSHYTRVKNQDNTFNVISVNIKILELLNVLNSLTLPENSLIHISDMDGQIIASNNETLIGNNISDTYGTPVISGTSTTFDGEKRHFITYFSEQLNYQFIVDIPYTYITQSANDSRQLLYGLYIVLLLILLIMVFVIRGFLLTPITEIIHKMRRVETGDFSAALPENRKDEFGIIYRNFNEMTRNINSLIQKNYIEEISRKESDLKYIQTQLNEHFLYNTLDSIYSLVLGGDRAKASNMVLSLSKFFRTTLNNGLQVITVNEIVDMLRNYADVMLTRTSNKYSIEFNVSKNVGSYYALKFLFQPVIENAIIHGVDNRKSGGIIKVSLYEEDNHIIYKVWDNGRGIDKETLDSLNGIFTDSYMMEESDYFALKNIYNQAKLFYREDFNFQITSIEYEYTEFVATLPVIEEKAAYGGQKND